MKISPLKVIKSDYLSTVSVIFPIVMIALYIDSAYIGVLHRFYTRGRLDTPGDSYVFLIMAIVTICIFIPILFIRIKKIAGYFQNGIEVKGRIVYLKLWKDRGRIEYEYKVGGKSYRSGNAVHKSKFVNSLAEGQEISLIVSKENPKKAFIRDMYVG